MPMIASRVIQTTGTVLCTALVAVLVSCVNGERSASVSSWVIESVADSSGGLRALVTKERSNGGRSSDVTIVSVVDEEGSRQVSQDRILVLAGSGPIDVRWQTPAILSVVCKHCGIPLTYATDVRTLSKAFRSGTKGFRLSRRKLIRNHCSTRVRRSRLLLSVQDCQMPKS